jgi:hypothetical protein
MPISPLAIARLHALALEYQHGWAAKFDYHSPPKTLEEALAGHDAAQDEDDEYTIVVPSLAHTTCSGRTSWTIADDGAVTARIYDIEPSQGGDRGEHALIERVTLTVAPDGSHILTQLEGCDIDDLDRACRVWRAVRYVCERAAEPDDSGEESPEGGAHCAPLGGMNPFWCPDRA